MEGPARLRSPYCARKSSRRAWPDDGKGKALGIETRGISDHGFVHSIYFPDPNGYVIELTAKMPEHARMMNPATNDARTILDRWQAQKANREANRESNHEARAKAGAG
jgi:catechol-2,3-dioxygenase